MLVHQASYTLGDLLYADRGRRPSKSERAVFHDAVRAIGDAVTPDRHYPPSSPATEYIPDPREAAVQTLESVAFRFTRRDERRGIPRRQSDQADVMSVIREVKAVLPGKVVVFGPYEGPGLRGTELRASATIHRANQSELSRV